MYGKYEILSSVFRMVGVHHASRMHKHSALLKNTAVHFLEKVVITMYISSGQFQNNIHSKSPTIEQILTASVCFLFLLVSYYLIFYSMNEIQRDFCYMKLYFVHYTYKVDTMYMWLIQNTALDSLL